MLHLENAYFFAQAYLFLRLFIGGEVIMVYLHRDEDAIFTINTAPEATIKMIKKHYLFKILY